MLRSVILFLALAFSPDHAIYISVVEIVHEGKSDASVSVKVFMDDLQNVIRNYSDNYELAGNEDFVNKNRTAVGKYFKEKLKFNVNDRVAEMTLVSSVIENDAYFLKFNLQSEADWNKLEIVGDFFTELFPDQSNVVTLNYRNEKYFARLTKSKPTYFISF